MQKRFYLDTSIWRDYFEDRSDNFKPLGEFAFQFLKNCLAKDFQLILSDVVILELKIRFSEQEINGLLASFEKAIVRVVASKEEYSEAKAEWLKREKRIPFKDVLHAIIAKNQNAVLISRDWHFFEELSAIVEAMKPEEVIFD